MVTPDQHLRLLHPVWYLARVVVYAILHPCFSLPSTLTPARAVSEKKSKVGGEFFLADRVRKYCYVCVSTGDGQRIDRPAIVEMQM